MAFPIINTKATNMELTIALQDLLEHKLHPLAKYWDAEETDVKCDVELEKMTEHATGPVHRAEVNLYVHGKLFRAEATEDQMEKAIDRVRDELKHELRTARGKRQSLIRRGGQAIKNMLRFGR